MALLKQSTAYTRMFLVVQSADHLSALTGATPTVNVSKAGGAFAAAGGTVTEVSSGFYKIALTTTDTNTLGDLAYHITAASGDPTDFTDQVVAVDVGDATAFGLSRIDAAITSRMATFTLPTNFAAQSIDASGRVDVGKVTGTAQTARDLGASVLLSAGTGTGQLDFTSGVVKANLAQILGTALTETAGQIAAAFKQFFNIASPTSTVNLVTSVGSVTGAVGSVTGAVGSVTGNVGGSVGSVVGAVGSVTGSVGGNVTGSVGSVATGGITAASIAADAIGASELAADAVTEIVNGVWNELESGHTTAGTFGRYLDAQVSTVGGGTAPTAAQNATAVRTELTTELGRIDVAISTRAASATGGTVGPGSISYPITVTRPDGITPIEGVSVWVSTDAAGSNVVAGTLVTDTLGRINGTVGFMLDAGTYRLWRQHGSWIFPNPTTIVVS